MYSISSGHRSFVRAKFFGTMVERLRVRDSEYFLSQASGLPQSILDLRLTEQWGIREANGSLFSPIPTHHTFTGCINIQDSIFCSSFSLFLSFSFLHVSLLSVFFFFPCNFIVSIIFCTLLFFAFHSSRVAFHSLLCRTFHSSCLSFCFPAFWHPQATEEILPRLRLPTRHVRVWDGEGRSGALPWLTAVLSAPRFFPFAWKVEGGAHPNSPFA